MYCHGPRSLRCFADTHTDVFCRSGEFCIGNAKMYEASVCVRSSRAYIVLNREVFEMQQTVAMLTEFFLEGVARAARDADLRAIPRSQIDDERGRVKVMSLDSLSL